jgi:hypothetical protein
MRTYYIVEHTESDGKVWRAHKRGIRSSLNIFDIDKEVCGTRTSLGPRECEAKLRAEVEAKKIKPRVVRVVRI